MVETRTHDKDQYWLARAKGLWYSDLWEVNGWLCDRLDDMVLPAEMDRLKAAIDKIVGMMRDR
jgi:hypothetical protein